MPVKRWVFTDPFVGESWTVPQNPREMSSLFGEKAVSMRTTTAVDGQPIVFEGNTPLAQWEFSGTVRTQEHYLELQRWVNKRNRIVITDHFGRTIPCYLIDFAPVPRRAINVYWFHDYTVRAIITGSIGEPTVGTEGVA